MVQCKKCNKFVSLAKDEITACKGPCEAVFHKKCETKKTLRNEKCEDCISLFSSPCHEEYDIATTLADINRKIEVMYNMEKKLSEVAELVDFISEKYDKLCEYQKLTEKKMEALENKNAYLEKCNKSMEERVNELEEKQKEKQVELAGVEKLQNEDIREVVEQVTQTLELDINQIEHAERAGRDKPDSKKPIPVVITLKTKEARDNWIKKRKQLD